MKNSTGRLLARWVPLTLGIVFAPRLLGPFGFGDYTWLAQTILCVVMWDMAVRAGERGAEWQRLWRRAFRDFKKAHPCYCNEHGLCHHCSEYLAKHGELPEFDFEGTRAAIEGKLDSARK